MVHFVVEQKPTFVVLSPGSRKADVQIEIAFSFQFMARTLPPYMHQQCEG